MTGQGSETCLRWPKMCPVKWGHLKPTNMDALIRDYNHISQRLNTLKWDYSHSEILGRVNDYPIYSLRLAECNTEFAYQPRVSILVPLTGESADFLAECLGSVVRQTYPHWELILVTSDDEPLECDKIVENLCSGDARVSVETVPNGVSFHNAYQKALKATTAEFIGVLDEQDELAPGAVWEVVRTLNHNAELDVLYSDEDCKDRLGNRERPWFKPDWSPDLLRSCPYVCRFLVCRASLVKGAASAHGLLEPINDYDLALRLAERTQRWKRIPKVLYHRRTTSGKAGATIEPRHSGVERQVLRSHVKSSGEDAEVLEVGPSLYRVRYSVVGSPRVAVIIPTGGRSDYLQRAIESVYSKTDYPNYRISVVDNSRGRRVKRIVRKFRGMAHQVRYVDMRRQPFNFSFLCNSAARECDDPFYLFLNDDVAVIDSEWMTALLEHGQRGGVGAVGARLLYPDGRIQHGGVALVPAPVLRASMAILY